MMGIPLSLCERERQRVNPPPQDGVRQHEQQHRELAQYCVAPGGKDLERNSARESGPNKAGGATCVTEQPMITFVQVPSCAGDCVRTLTSTISIGMAA
jgi:hypothetical protein